MEAGSEEEMMEWGLGRALFLSWWEFKLWAGLVSYVSVSFGRRVLC